MNRWKRSLIGASTAALLLVTVAGAAAASSQVQTSGYGQGPGASEVAPISTKANGAPIEVTGLPNTGGGSENVLGWLPYGVAGGAGTLLALLGVKRARGRKTS